MNVKILVVGLLCLVWLNGPALAQQCPPGIAHGTPGCIPPNNPASPLYPDNTPPPSVSPVIWEDRWGAIAIDFTKGKVGAVTGMHSKSKAEKFALAQCRKNGGVKCEKALSYYNQCGVIAWGASHISTYGAETIEKASALAINACSRHTKDCQIYYANCSMAERVQ